VRSGRPGLLDASWAGVHHRGHPSGCTQLLSETHQQVPGHDGADGGVGDRRPDLRVG
jgi:hypothetical protein